MRKRNGIALVLVALSGAGVARPAQADSASLAAAVEAFNALPEARSPLRIEPQPGGEWRADAGAVPNWLGTAGLSPQEERAVLAALGAYGLDQDLPSPPRRRSPVGAYLGTVAGAMVVDSARGRAASYPVDNTQTRSRDPRDLGPRSGAAWSESAAGPDERMHAMLIGLQSCAGAYFSAVGQLNRAFPHEPLTRFLREIAIARYPAPSRADPGCASA